MSGSPMINPADKSEAPATVETATPPKGYHTMFRGLLQRRSLWLIGALLVAIAGASGYHWAFGKAKVVYATAPVTRGDLESTVVAAGIVQPVKYVDVGAQT